MWLALWLVTGWVVVGRLTDDVHLVGVPRSMV